MTRTLDVDPDCPDPDVLLDAAQILREGGLVAFATETVYGLGADATNPAAVARIFEAKGRPSSNPLIVHVDGVDMARSCVSAWPPAAEALAARFWPGPLTLVLPRSGLIPDIVTAGHATVGIRIPRPNVARALIGGSGRPIAAPSANRSTGVSPTQARHVLKDLDGKVDLILDCGPTAIGLESTVLDLSTRGPRILRPGSITASELESALGGARVREAVDPGSPAPTASPGQMAIHYAPRTKAIRVDASDLESFEIPWPSALFLFGPHDLPPTPRFAHRYELRTPEQAARALYTLLHSCDEQGIRLIVVVPPPDLPEWHAIRDRLRRATSQGA